MVPTALNRRAAMNETQGAPHPIPRAQHYDIRRAAQCYSNIAAYLAGFALLAVVVIVQIITSSMTSQKPLDLDTQQLLKSAVTPLLIGFLGCVMAAFTMAVVAGEEELAPRSHSVALLGAAGFALATVYIFWGLVVLVRAFFPEQLPTTRGILAAIILISPPFVYLPAQDIIRVFGGTQVNDFWRETGQPSRATQGGLIAAGYGPIVVGWGVGCIAFSSRTTLLNCAAWLSIVLLAVGAAFTLWNSDRVPHEYKGISPRLGGFWTGIHSLLFGLLFALSP
jgi:hypothetical protein